jgi:hypothetical protein
MNQLSFLPEPPFFSITPRRGRLPERALFDLAESDITQLDWLKSGNGWRLSAPIKVLGHLGWEPRSRLVGCDGRTRSIAINDLHTSTNDADLRAGGVVDQAPSDEAIESQIARLTLAGHIVHQGKDGDFYVRKYGLSRYCQNFAELHAFARQLGVSQ